MNTKELALGVLAELKAQGYVIVPMELPDSVKAAMFTHGYTPPNPRSTWEFILRQLGVAYTEPLQPLIQPTQHER